MEIIAVIMAAAIWKMGYNAGKRTARRKVAKLLAMEQSK